MPRSRSLRVAVVGIALLVAGPAVAQPASQPTPSSQPARVAPAAAPTGPAAATPAPRPAAATGPSQATAARRPSICCDGRSYLQPYGYVLFNGVYNTHAVNNIDVPALVTTTPNGNSLSATLRQTRVGLNLRWPDPIRLLGGARVSAKIEVDFFGGLANAGIGDFAPIPRLRLAAMTIAWGPRLQLVIGQDWIILAPLTPTTIAHQAVVGFAAAGNLWFRLPQVRLQGKLGDRHGVEWALGVLAPFDAEPSDPAAAAFQGNAVAGPGERSKLPALQARVATFATVGPARIVLGLSGHLSKERYDLATTPGTTRDIRSWAVAGDLSIPIGRWALLQGEVYTGRNLDLFWGGALQGVRKVLDPTDTAKRALLDVWAIRSSGGWGQIVVTPWRWLALSAGAGMDRPDPDDLYPQDPATQAIVACRTRNTQVYAAAQLNATAKLHFALEVDRMWTRWMATDGTQSTHPNTHVNLAAQYEF